MIKTTNKEAIKYINSQEEFKGSNTFSEWVNDNYIIYSYGKHFPIYMYEPRFDRWYGNSDKYSVTTSKHQSQLKPWGDILYISKEELQMRINKY